MVEIRDINDFLNKLDDNKIYYRINKIRNESILVEVAIPGQRWEIEFMEDGTIEVEKFISEGSIYNRSELEVLFSEYAD